MRKVVAASDLGKMTFKTCLAGTIHKVQMLTMLIVELVYHKCYKQVKFHREIFKFKDGG
jgi:phage-related holin